MNLETADFETWPWRSYFLIIPPRDCVLDRFDILLTLYSLVDYYYIRDPCQPCQGKKR